MLRCHAEGVPKNDQASTKFSTRPTDHQFPLHDLDLAGKKGS